MRRGRTRSDDRTARLIQIARISQVLDQRSYSCIQFVGQGVVVGRGVSVEHALVRIPAGMRQGDKGRSVLCPDGVPGNPGRPSQGGISVSCVFVIAQLEDRSDRFVEHHLAGRFVMVRLGSHLGAERSIPKSTVQSFQQRVAFEETCAAVFSEIVVLDCSEAIAVGWRGKRGNRPAQKRRSLERAPILVQRKEWWHRTCALKFLRDDGADMRCFCQKSGIRGVCRLHVEDTAIVNRLPASNRPQNAHVVR